MKALVGAALLFAVPAWSGAPPAKPALAKNQTKPGPLTPDVIKDVVGEHRAEARRCYEAAAAKRPRLNGKVVVRFRIGLDGKVSEAAVASSSLNELGVETCLVTSAKGWLFPKPKHCAVEVNFPFTFGPPKASPPPSPQGPTADQAPEEAEPDVLR